MLVAAPPISSSAACSPLLPPLMRFLSPYLLLRRRFHIRNPSSSSSLVAAAAVRCSPTTSFLSAPPRCCDPLRRGSTPAADRRVAAGSRSGSSSSSSSSPSPSMAGMASMLSEVEASTAKRFWKQCQREAACAACTPFVICLASGSLDIDCFRNYIAQDVHFLSAFVQAYEMTENYADDDDAKMAIRKLRKAVKEEMKLHGTVVQEWGLDPTKDISIAPATKKYTDFLLATAAGQISDRKTFEKIVTPFEKTKLAAYVVGAMTPCMRLYAFLGKELEPYLHLGGKDHAYKKWIDNYSSKSFEEAAVEIEDLLDNLSTTLTGEELDVILSLYRQAMKLEFEFFATQPIIQPVVAPLSKLLNPTNRLILFSDFDLTCSAVDSSAILAEISIQTAVHAEKASAAAAARADHGGASHPGPLMPSSDLRNSWSALSRRYTEDFEKCIESILTSEIAKKFDYDGLHKGMEQISEFEKAANARVVEASLLQGIDVEKIRQAGDRLQLQAGCREFFQKATSEGQKLNAEFHVLSYCWCEDLIRPAISSGSLNVLNIHCNQFEYKDNISTGGITRIMESPLDKLAAFKNILNGLNSDGGGSSDSLTVYIGDSMGDMLCLLEADIGIIIGSSASLRRVGTHFGVSFVPLAAGLVHKQREIDKVKLGDAGSSAIWKGSGGVVFTVSSWPEIQAFILGELL